MDVYARSRWHEYSKAKDDMFHHTDTDKSPWYVVDAENKREARLNCINHLLSKIEYESIPYPDVSLPSVPKRSPSRPAMREQRHIPQVYK